MALFLGISKKETLLPSGNFILLSKVNNHLGIFGSNKELLRLNRVKGSIFVIYL
jgi:hypothetical protein